MNKTLALCVFILHSPKLTFRNRCVSYTALSFFKPPNCYSFRRSFRCLLTFIWLKPTFGRLSTCLTKAENFVLCECKIYPFELCLTETKGRRCAWNWLGNCILTATPHKCVQSLARGPFIAPGFMCIISLVFYVHEAHLENQSNFINFFGNFYFFFHLLLACFSIIGKYLWVTLVCGQCYDNVKVILTFFTNIILPQL